MNGRNVASVANGHAIGGGAGNFRADRQSEDGAGAEGSGGATPGASPGAMSAHGAQDHFPLAGRTSELPGTGTAAAAALSGSS